MPPTITLAGPNLVLENLSLPNGNAVAPGGTLTGVTATLQNTGVGAVPAGSPVTIQAFLSTTTTFSPATAILLGSFSISGGLASGASIALPAQTLTVTNSQVGGNYQLIYAAADPNGAGSSTGTLSNTLEAAVTVSAADLAVTAPTTATTSIGIDTTLGSVSTFVVNEGAQAFVGGYTVNLYVSTTSSFDSTAQLLATITQSATLNSLSSIQLSWNNVAVPNLVPGSYFLISQVTPLGTQIDSNPANNTASTGVALAGPQLSLGSFVFPDTTSVAAGGSFGNVSYQLTNAGAGAVPAGTPVTIQVFLSTTSTFNAGTAVLLDQYSFSGGVPAGGTVILPNPSRPINLPQNGAERRL